MADLSPLPDPTSAAHSAPAPMVDPFGRTVSYLRVSVTDRCDFRCTYCMAEQMTFLPKPELLSLEELDRLVGAFITRGVRNVRLTGGEPLVRRNVMWLIESLGSRLGDGLDELTLTTNGSQLSRFAEDLYATGVRRVNVSLDTRDPDRFRKITRWGRLEQVLGGIEAAKAAGLSVKINTVALKGENEHELKDMLEWCAREGLELTFIETMPMGEIDGARSDQYLPLSEVRRRLSERYELIPSTHKTSGPARYFTVRETGQSLGFITPLTHNFCESCNRVRLTCTGRLFMCLGQDDDADLRAVLRANPHDDTPLFDAIDEAISRKPKGHDFHIGHNDKRGRGVSRRMSETGG
ncbi:MAG: GTP 3',8-cyclase MoaA [Pseudomonadota bacterium]